MTSDGPDAKKQKSDDDWRRTSFKIADVNPHLVCALCGGYFRDCHTITECLHSFCQVCILAHLRQNKNSCPRCGVDLGPHPMTAVLHDRQLQAIVDKIFPEFEDIDRQARQARRSLEAPPSAPRARPRAAKTARAPEEEVSFKVEQAPLAAGEEPLPIELLDKPYLKTNGNLKVGQLRKYLARKMRLRSEELELLCDGEELSGEHALRFVKGTVWTKPSELVIQFRRAAGDA